MSRAQEIAAAVNKEMGPGSLKLGSDPSLTVKLWPTGVLPFDVILGGGLPAGRSIEVYGGFSTLKSYLALRSIASVQEQGGVCGLVDSEHAFDPSWAASLGVDVDNLILQHPENGEQAVMATTTLIVNELDLVVWDSIAALLPKAYQEATPGDSRENQPARLATLMSKGMARMNSANSQTSLFLINQTRTNLSITFGSKETTPGGNAVPFYTSMRLRLAKAGRITRDVKVDDTEKEISTKEIVGHKIKATLDKSKLNRPHREVWFQFNMEDASVDETNFLIAQGLEMGLITQPSKARFTIEEWMDGSVHGRKQLREWLDEEPEVVEWLAEKVMEKHLA